MLSIEPALKAGLYFSPKNHFKPRISSLSQDKKTWVKDHFLECFLAR
jgi:hypothetical protein